MEEPDVRVTYHGTVWVFEALTPAVQTWFEKHTLAPCIGNSYAVYAVEWWSVAGIMSALCKEGFDLCCSAP
jgi:hypothetical protein